MMERTPTDDHRLELGDGRTIGYTTWGDPDGTPVFICHGTPGSRLALSPGLDDPEWIRQHRLLFVGVDRPGYGYSDSWAEASVLDCAGDLVRVADDLGLEHSGRSVSRVALLTCSPSACWCPSVSGAWPS